MGFYFTDHNTRYVSVLIFLSCSNFPSSSLFFVHLLLSFHNGSPISALRGEISRHSLPRTHIYISSSLVFGEIFDLCLVPEKMLGFWVTEYLG